MKSFLKLLVPVTTLLLIFSCSKDDSDDVTNNGEPDIVLSSENEIKAFKIIIEENEYVPDVSNDSITWAFPASIDLSKSNTIITISEKATISPESGIVQDFTKPVTYTVTAEDGNTNTYVVNLTSNAAREGNSIRVVGFEDIDGPYSSSFSYEDDLVTVRTRLPYETPLTALTSNFILSDGATSIPASGETLDYTNPVEYTITAENGNQRNYIIIVDNSLEQVQLPGLTGNQFLDKRPGDLIDLQINSLNPFQERNRINLIDGNDPNSKTELVIESINYETSTVSVRLPQSYRNSTYTFEIFIEDDNTDISDGFRLEKGTPNFVFVTPFRNDNNVSTSYGSVLSPGEALSAKVYVDDTRFDQHKFYLRKGMTDVLLSDARRLQHFDEIAFTVPDLIAQGIDGGNDFKFVIEIDGAKTVYDFINDEKQNINIIAANSPDIDSLTSNIVEKGQSITLTGANLFYPIQPNTRTFYYLEGSQLRLTATTGSKTYDLQSINGNANQINFEVLETVQTGTYTLSFRNNIKAYDWIDTGLSVTIVLAASQHPTIAATNAIFYGNPTSGIYRQIRVEFNQNIEGVSVERLLFANNTIEIGNYFTYPTSVLTGQVTGEQANAILNNPDGKAIINDAGVVSEVPFTVVLQN